MLASALFNVLVARFLSGRVSTPAQMACFYVPMLIVTGAIMLKMRTAGNPDGNLPSGWLLFTALGFGFLFFVPDYLYFEAMNRGVGAFEMRAIFAMMPVFVWLVNQVLPGISPRTNYYHLAAFLLSLVVVYLMYKGQQQAAREVLSVAAASNGTPPTL